MLQPPTSNFKLRSSSGFTLLELILYVGIFSIAAVLMTGILYNALRVQNREGSASSVTSESQFVMQTIQRLVKESSLIDMAPNATSTTLTLWSRSSTSTPITVYASGSIVYLKNGPATPDALTSAQVSVSSLVFTKFANPPGKDTVQVDLSMAVASNNPQSAFSKTSRSAFGRITQALFDSSILPSADNAYDIGTSTARFRDGHFSGVFAAETSLGIGTQTVATSAIADFTSNSKGVLLPRMTTAERDAIALPARGLEIYNLDTGVFNFWDGTQWTYVSNIGWTASGSNAYLNLSGNISLFSSTTFPEKLYLNGGGFLQTFGTSSVKVAGGIFDSTNFQLTTSIAVSGHYAYTGTEICGAGYPDFTVIDVSNPASPQVVGTLDDKTNFCHVAAIVVSGRYAYVTNDDPTAPNSFVVVDVANPHLPKVVGAIAAPSDPQIARPQHMAVSGHYAYVSAIQGGSGQPQFIVVDIGDPTHPRIVGSLTDDDNLSRIGGLVVSGRYAYVANGNDFNGTANFAVIDISDPTLPKLAGTPLDDETHLYGPENLALSGRYAYVVTNDHGISGKSDFAVVDVANPALPQVVASLDDDADLGHASSLVVSGRYVYVTNYDATAGRANFAVVDILSPLSPKVVATLDNDTYLTNATALAVSGRYAYTANNVGGGLDPPFAGFAVLDLSGLDVSGANIGSLEAGQANILGTLRADSIHAGTSLNIGIGGIYSQGPVGIVSRTIGISPALSVDMASSGALFRVFDNGNVSVGSASSSSGFYVPDGKYFQSQDFNSGVPAAGDCDADAERGRISFNTASTTLMICNGQTRAWDYIQLGP